VTQIGFSLSEAHKALDEVLAQVQAGERPDERWIADGDLDKKHGVAVRIVAADAYDAMSAGYASWLEAQEVAGDDADLPPGYRPWTHSPLGSTDRLLPIEPLQEPLARIFYGKPYTELSKRTFGDHENGTAASRPDEAGKVDYAAIACLLRVTLDPDGQGAVPVLAVGHEEGEPGPPLRWQIAYVTSVPGLFLRATGNGFLDGQWGIITGSGWRVVDGYYERETATAAIEALGRILPNTDWMRLTPDAFTPAAKKAIVATIRRYARWGLEEKHPEPEPMTDAVPPAEPMPGTEPATAS
jgi:hypothetical protein